MAWEFSPFLLPSFVAGAIATGLAAYALRHRAKRAAHPFALLMVGVAWWAFAYGIELGFTDLKSMLYWDKIAFVGSVTVPAAFLLLAVEYAGLDDRLPDWAPLVLAVEPVLTLAILWGKPASDLVWRSTSVVHAGGLTLPGLSFGPVYWANYAYSYLLIVVALGLFASVYVRGSRIYRRQSALLVLGAIAPLAANVLFNVLRPWTSLPPIDLTTFAMSIMGALYADALFRFDVLNRAPAAHHRLVRSLGVGYAVVDPDGHIAEHNRVGRTIVESTPELFGDDRAAIDMGFDGLGGRVVSGTVDGSPRSYELGVEPVRDFRDEVVGLLLVFRDITELETVRDQEQRLSVLNRILRHNIRNEATLIAGYADLLDPDEDECEHVDLIAERARTLSTLGEKARHVTPDPERTASRRRADVVPIVRTVVEEFRADHPEATISFDPATDVTALIDSTTSLETAVENLLENAVEHHDRPDPEVSVTVDADQSTAVITTADDGPGIPPVERAVLSADSETPLEHGSGLGLWLVHWLVTGCGGSLSFGENEPRGSVVTIKLPRAAGGG